MVNLAQSALALSERDDRRAQQLRQNLREDEQLGLQSAQVGQNIAASKQNMEAQIQDRAIKAYSMFNDMVGGAAMLDDPEQYKQALDLAYNSPIAQLVDPQREQYEFLSSQENAKAILPSLQGYSALVKRGADNQRLALEAEKTLSQIENYKSQAQRRKEQTEIDEMKLKDRAGGSMITLADGTVIRQGGKALSPQLQRFEQGERVKMQGMYNAGADIGEFVDKIDSGDLNLGFISNIVSKVRNNVGLSNEESVAFQDFQGALNKLRDDILMQAKGTQTEGDAERAMKQVMENINDPKAVKSRLMSLQGKFDRELGQSLSNYKSFMRQNQQEIPSFGELFGDSESPFKREQSAPQVKPQGAQASGKIEFLGFE